ncbi:MAG: hypothetical protein GX318_07795 [Clostridia bacterium]|nr:hypothetical protein [Clostridia bacterium]
MGYYYEFINPKAQLPVKASIHNVDEIKAHWHRYEEIALLLAGTVKYRFHEKEYLLRAGDIT